MYKFGRSASRSPAGFTLIELMVVVMIIAILIAVAIPTFLGARSRSQARAVQHDLTAANAILRERYISGQPVTIPAMDAAEPSFEWQSSGPAESPGIISFWTHATEGSVYTTAMGENDRCYMLYYKDRRPTTWPTPFHYAVSDPPCTLAWVWGPNSSTSNTRWPKT